MSLLWMENFQYYGTSTANMLAGMPWAALSGASLVNDPDGVSGGKVLSPSKNDVGISCRFVIPTAGDVHNLGFRLWLSQLPDSGNHSQEIILRDASNNNKYALRTSPTGALSLIRKTDSTTVATTAAPVIGAGVWYHIEWMMNRTSGAYEVRVEGVTVLSGTDGSPATGDSGIVNFIGSWSSGSGASNTSMYIKDLFIADDAGSVNNGFIGPVTIYTLVPDGDVSNGWALSTGSTAYSLIDELAPADTDYVQADATPPAACVVSLTDLPGDVVSIRAMQSVVRALKTDGGDATLQASFVSSGDEDNGADNAVGTSVGYKYDVSELDPHTGTAWTPITGNAAELKLDRTL